MENTMTYVKALEIAINALEDGEAKDKLVKLSEQLVKRATAKSSKPTKTQRENETVKVEILDTLNAIAEPVQVGALATAMGNKYSVPKLTALLVQLGKAGSVVRTVDKGKAFYAVA